MGFSYKQIAGKVGCSVGSVYQIIRKQQQQQTGTVVWINASLVGNNHNMKNVSRTVHNDSTNLRMPY